MAAAWVQGRGSTASFKQPLGLAPTHGRGQVAFPPHLSGPGPLCHFPWAVQGALHWRWEGGLGILASGCSVTSGLRGGVSNSLAPGQPGSAELACWILWLEPGAWRKCPLPRGQRTAPVALGHLGGSASQTLWEFCLRGAGNLGLSFPPDSSAEKARCPPWGLMLSSWPHQQELGSQLPRAGRAPEWCSVP